MKKIRNNVAGRLAVATVLSLGLCVGGIGIASASQTGNNASHSSSWTFGNSIKGVVTGYVAGTSISIEARNSTTATTYALTSATTITGLATGASLLNAKVVLTLSSTTPVSVLSIKVATPKLLRTEGVVTGYVTGYVAGTSISIEARNSTTATTYALTSATTITGLTTGASLLNAKVVLTLSSTTPVSVLSIKVATPKLLRTEGVVTGYVAGTSISIEARNSTTATTYALTSATTITGLATGASLLNAKVVLTLSSTTPVNVLSIKVATNNSKCHGGNGEPQLRVGGSFTHSFHANSFDSRVFSHHGNSRK